MLEFSNLTCGYDSGFFLKDISFNVKDKDFVGIIGANGSGKTTLLKSVTKLVKIRKGTIFFENKNIQELDFKQISRKIAVVSQRPEVSFKIRVEEFVLLGRIPYIEKWQFIETNQDREIVYRAMEETDTLDLRNRLVDSLSGGERQLVVLARALAQQPRLLLLDEPTNHLDIGHQIKMLDLIKKINRENGLTVIIILHDLNLASEYCDKLILLDKGLMYKTGTPNEVLTYENIEAVYKTPVLVEKNPISSKPYVLLVSKEEIDKRNG
ncbi:MAG: ABC transporter ATP-binding protein [Candidatus Omnitrophica bacterium]|nr:ABC transporter ATP-binding protein [Candidatus Omnitrophota bacterium]MCK5392778.1 ABC transporter ATP-binding protein [Candidatus Omnitrophota bacterium]